MANITLTIPDSQVQSVLNAVCVALGYKDTVPDTNSKVVPVPQIPNPVTKAQFVKSYLVAHVRTLVTQGLKQPAAKSAEDTAQGQADALSIS